MSEKKEDVVGGKRLDLDPQAYLGDPGSGILAKIHGRIGRSGIAATYCDCSTCSCDACSCNCSCNACGACYCDCSCSDMTIVWRQENFTNLARIMEALNLRIGEIDKISDAIKHGR